MSGAGLDLELLGWPLAAGLLVLATHVPLGRRVLARGIIVLDLAIAQIAVLGVVAAHAFTWRRKAGLPSWPLLLRHGPERPDSRGVNAAGPRFRKR